MSVIKQRLTVRELRRELAKWPDDCTIFFYVGNAERLGTRARIVKRILRTEEDRGDGTVSIELGYDIWWEKEDRLG